MWRELLGVEQVGRNDDFFELGGQSLIAVRLFSRMRKKYSIDLPLATLFEAPTIAQCAAIVARSLGIDDVDEPAADGSDTFDTETDVAGVAVPAARPGPRVEPAAFRSLVTIQKGGDHMPFFCAHGAGGNVLNFRDLSQAMGRTQPFYGLQARGVDGVLTPHESIAEMAAAYLEEVRAVQPHGPYMFGGYSGGGLIAYEMAQQVTAAGETVAMVVLLDTIPFPISQIPLTLKRRLIRLRDERTQYLRDVVTCSARKRPLAQGNRPPQRDPGAAGETVPSELRELHIERAFARAVEHYEVKPWAGRCRPPARRGTALHLRRPRRHLRVGQDRDRRRRADPRPRQSRHPRARAERHQARAPAARHARQHVGVHPLRRRRHRPARRRRVAADRRRTPRVGG